MLEAANEERLFNCSCLLNIIFRMIFQESANDIFEVLRDIQNNFS
jgi:hypothetical protein